MMRRTLVALAVLAGSVGVPSPAEACFDGFTTASEQTNITQVTDGTWSMHEARTMARWTHRFEALLPDGKSLRMQSFWAVELCEGDDCDDLVVFDPAGKDVPPTLDAMMARVFEGVADAVGATPRARAKARATGGLLYAVQVGSYRILGNAEKVAETLNFKVQSGEQTLPEHTFYSAGGYPAIHPVAGIHAVDVGDARFHRVVVGTYLDAKEALAQRDALRKLGFTPSISATKL